MTNRQAPHLSQCFLLFVLFALSAGFEACAPVPTASLTPPGVTATIALPTQTPFVASPSPLPTGTDCTSNNGTIEQGSLKTALLSYPLAYQIYLPPCYAESTERRYPVLYLLHGQTYTDQQWIRLGVPQVLDRLIVSGEVEPYLVVMPQERYWQQPDDTNFDEALTGDLIPAVDETYRTLPDRQHRAIGGLSRGGGWAIHLGLTRWELFGAFGAHSPAIFWLDDKHLAAWLAAIPPESLPRIYVDSGDNDKELKSTLEFEQLLTSAGVPHEWHLFTGFHDETYWRAHVEDYLRWYAAGW